jgi:hypothetical protein
MKKKKKQIKSRVELKPCVCDVMPEIRDGWIYIGWPFKCSQGFYVVCPTCGTQTDIRGTKNSAIRDWNHERVFNEPVQTKVKKYLRWCKALKKFNQEYNGNWRIK